MIPIPDAIRREILRLDMHGFPVPQIAQLTGANRSTVQYILRRIGRLPQSPDRGNVMLVHDPAGIFPVGARFNTEDAKAMVRFSGLEDGTLFEFIGRNSRRRAEVRGGELVDISTGGGT